MNDIPTDAEAQLRYQADFGVSDESMTPEGARQAHWSYVMQSFEDMAPADIQERLQKAERLLRDDGASYNIYSDTDTETEAVPKSWALDLVPSIVTSDQWATIESGLLERAELFNLLLKDIYSERSIISSGLIPPEALFCHPGFLRACQGIQIPGDHQLVLHCADMIRTADNRLVVVDDRTQVPSGSGYTLENRTVMSRVFPSLFRNSQVHRVSTYFQRLRAKLMSLSDNQTPRVVILTPGTHNETYFEHSYLANYLGFPLVQSGDLVVRNGFLWMKSLDGLKRVDVVWRRVDDSYCDPVELRADSQLGVAGLLEVVRAGNLVIANPLGSGILENPIFYRYLPALAKHFLGREPRLDTVTTWWYGTAEDRAYIDAHFDELIIKPLIPHRDFRGACVADMADEDRERLRQHMLHRPEYFVAQEILVKSHMPSLEGTHFCPRPTVLRSFACANETSYTILPGGLTRVGHELNERFIRMQTGSRAKDTWVISSELEPDTEPLEASRPIHLDLQLQSLPSRAVENLFWMGRYAERAEAGLRLIRTLFALLNSDDPIAPLPQKRLLEALSTLTTTTPGFIDNPALIENPEAELLSVINDGNRTGSIRNTLNAMLLSGDASKELLSLDTTRVINDIRDALNALDRAVSYNPDTVPDECLDPLVTALMALSGLTHESMVRGIGWRFMNIGKRVERALQTLKLVKALLIPAASVNEQETLLRALLLTFEMLITYRRRYRTNVDIEAGLDLVLLDSNNPRSIIFQLQQLSVDIQALPRPEQLTRELNDEQRCVLQAQTLLQLSQLQELAQPTDKGRENLRELVDNLDNQLEQLSNVLSDTYFDHRVSHKQLVKGFWPE